MNKREIPWRKNILTKQIAALLLILIPIYIIGFSIYNWGVNSVSDEICNTTAIQVSFYLNTLEKDMQRTQVLQGDFLNDYGLNNLAGASSVMSNYERDQTILRIQQRLYAIVNSSQYIEQADVHIIPLGLTINAAEARKTSQEEMIKIKSLSDVHGTAVYFLDGNILINALGPTSEFYSRDNLPQFFFEISLNNTVLAKVLDDINTYANSGSFLYSEKSGYLNTGSSNPDTVREVIRYLPPDDPNQKFDTLKVKLDGKSCFVIYSYSDYLKMKLVRYIPENMVLEKIKTYRIWFWVFTFVTLCIIIIFSLYTNSFIHKPLRRLLNAFDKIENGDFNIEIKHNHDDEFTYIYKRFNHMTGKLGTLIDQVYKQKILVQKAELKQLQSQINPHFLYNSFFILSRRVKHGDLDNAILFCEQLGNYFRFITRSAEGHVPLSKEVEHARIYAEIQASRFSNRISVEFEELPEGFGNIIVPRLILQPIIENAFEHGLEDKEIDGKLYVRFAAGEDESQPGGHRG
jgi:two-component system sensor histidine kinase YesM